MKRSLRSLLERHELLLEGAEDDIIDKCVDDLFYVIEKVLDYIDVNILDAISDELINEKNGVFISRLLKRFQTVSDFLNLPKNALRKEIETSIEQGRSLSDIEKCIAMARKVCDAFDAASQRQPRLINFVKHIIELCSVETYDNIVIRELNSYILQLPSDWPFFISKIAKNGNKILDDLFVMAGIANALQGMTSGEIDNLSEQISKSLGKFNDFLRMRREKLAKTPYESDSGKLDHYAFAEERPGQVPFEKDNKYEKELYQQLLHHFVSNESPSLEAVKTIKDFLVKGEYSTIFHAPEQDVVYRGMVVNHYFLATALGVESFDKTGNKETDFTFTPKEKVNVTSWTTSFAMAIEYSESISSQNDIKLIMYARVEDNPDKFVSCQNGLYAMSGIDSFHNEHEVLGLGPIKVYKIAWEMVESDW